jgi:trehalose 6-phosphate phosphatase
MMKYRSHDSFLPISFKDLTPILTRRPSFVFLDRDGTIVPIADNPKDAVLQTATAEILQKLSGRLSKRVAIVSARGLNTLAMECDPSVFILAGNYGLEISFPSGRKLLHPAVQAVSSLLAELRFDLGQIVRFDTRLLLDDHQYSFCLHHHRIPKVEQHVVHDLILDLKQKYSSLQFRALPTSYEIVPDIEWSKADALDKIVNVLSLDASDYLCMAFGDSPADEPMFGWVNHHQGVSFCVGERASTQALGCFDSPDAVIAFLQQLVLL